MTIIKPEDITVINFYNHRFHGPTVTTREGGTVRVTEEQANQLSKAVDEIKSARVLSDEAATDKGE